MKDVLLLFRVPTIYETVNGNKLILTIGGVRAYNHTNLYSKKGAERFKVFSGFICKVCTNLCVSTDGFLSCLEVTNTKGLISSCIRDVSELPTCQTFTPIAVT